MKPPTAGLFIEKLVAGAIVLLAATSVCAQDDLDFLFGNTDAEESESIESSENATDEKASEANQPRNPGTEPTVSTIPVEEPAPDKAAELSETRQPKTGPQLEEIIVTAQKRQSSLQDTPISMEAFSADMMAERGIAGVADLTGQVPSITIEPFPTHNATLRIYIRGVGIIDSQLTQDPPVGIYIDGVYIARSVGLALDIADLERIEVLRGPQGTLYGRNTTGGAVNLITRRPNVEQADFSQSITVGQRNSLRGRMTANLPISDNFAVKFSALASGKNGFMKNDNPGGDFGDKTEGGLRFDARWQPDFGLVADYSGEYVDMEYFHQLFQAVSRPRTDKATANFIVAAAEARSVYSDRRLDRLAAGAELVASGALIKGHSLTLAQPLETGFGGFELKYIGAYRELTDKQYADLGGGLGSLEYRLDTGVYDGPAADLANGGPTPLVVPTIFQSQQTHELQLTGDFLDDRLSLVAGLYYFEEEGIEDRRGLNHQFSAPVAPAQVGELGVAGLVAGQNNVRLVQFLDYLYGIENTAEALFFQATYRPPIWSERFSFTLGYRHSEDRRKALKDRITDTYVEFLDVNGDGQATLLSSSEVFDNVRGDNAFDNDSFSYVVTFDLTDDINFYAKSVEGYKSGGYNVRDPQVSAASGPASDGTNYGFGFVEGFGPENVLSYELGFRSQWLDRRLRVNATLFDTRIEDMQINFLIPGTVFDTKVINAGKSRITGLELDTTWLLHQSLTLSLDYAYLDAVTEEVIDIEGNNVANLFPFGSAPEHSGVVSLDWSPFQGDWGELRANLTYSYTDFRQGIVIVEEKRGLTSLPSYSTLNLRLSLANMPMGDGRMRLSFAGKNILDREYEISAIDNLPHADRAVIWGEPRHFGLQLSYDWQ